VHRPHRKGPPEDRGRRAPGDDRLSGGAWGGTESGSNLSLASGSNVEYREPEIRFRRPRSPPEEQFSVTSGCDVYHVARTLSIP
jgi:hypothetical protein